jgi:hypothetical protein
VSPIVGGAHEQPCMIGPLRPAAVAFDAIAPTCDARFGAWSSVAAQRRAVRAALLGAFPIEGHILEVGGGTGEDAAFLAERGFDMLLTDPRPRWWRRRRPSSRHWAEGLRLGLVKR